MKFPKEMFMYPSTDLMKADFLTKAVIRDKLAWSCEKLN